MRLNKKDGLNIVPFIDIMLVLLAIVLSISTFIAQGKIKVDLPQAAHSQKKNDEKSIVVVVDKDNRIFIDDNETNIDELSAKFEQISSEISQNCAQISASRSAVKQKFETILNKYLKNE